MIINNFDFVRRGTFPPKTHTPLVVDTNAVLSSPFALQRFQPISGRYRYVPQFRGGLQALTHGVNNVNFFSSVKARSPTPRGKASSPARCQPQG